MMPPWAGTSSISGRSSIGTCGAHGGDDARAEVGDGAVVQLVEIGAGALVILVQHHGHVEAAERRQHGEVAANLRRTWCPGNRGSGRRRPRLPRVARARPSGLRMGKMRRVDRGEKIGRAQHFQHGEGTGDLVAVDAGGKIKAGRGLAGAVRGPRGAMQPGPRAARAGARDNGSSSRRRGPPPRSWRTKGAGSKRTAVMSLPRGASSRYSLKWLIRPLVEPSWVGDGAEELRARAGSPWRVACRARRPTGRTS